MKTHYFALPILVLAMTSGMAAELSPASRTEINALLNRLASSGCQFNRNGTWYNPVDARAHLVRKLDYLIEKKQVESTEQFIDLAASSSSSSGKNYQVRCGSQPAVASGVWLKGELQALRAGK